MDIFFNPDIAYVLLISGFVLALLAIAAPGTGLLEVGALFLLALAGVIVYRIGFNLWALILLLLALVPFIYALRKPKREWALILSIIGIIAGSLYLFPSKGFLPAVNPILAVLVSLFLAGFIWWAVGKTIIAHHVRPLQDLQHLVGQVGESKTHIQDEGSVQVAGELWSARSDKPIPPGRRVRVIGREGFLLVVAPDERPKN